MHIGKPSLRVALCALALGVLPVAADAASMVNVVLQDPSTGSGVTKMQIVPTPATVPAGKVTFRIFNESKSLVHEMLLLNAPAAGKLPYSDTAQRVNESKTVKLVDTDDIKPGASATETMTLRRGKYLMICNQPGHYASGMEASFTVTR